MQCHRVVRREVCCGHNAYISATALRATFGTAARRQDAKDSADAGLCEDIPSPWVQNRWATLPPNPANRELEAENGAKKDMESDEDLKLAPSATQAAFAFAPFRSATETRTRTDQAATFTRQGAGKNRNESSGGTKGIFRKRGSGGDNDILTKQVEADEWQDSLVATIRRFKRLSLRRDNAALDMTSNRRAALRREEFEYEPFHVLPRKAQHAGPPLLPPWVAEQSDSPYSTGRQFLETELKGFGKWVTCSRCEFAARKSVEQETMATIRAALQDDVSVRTCMEVYGSQRTGLALPWSDIDIRIYDDREQPLPWHLAGPQLANRLQLVAEKMRNSGRWNVVAVREDFYPILNAQHIGSGLDIQIVAGLDCHAQEAVVRQYLKEMPWLRNVFYAVRTFFSMRGFNDVHAGGLGSYGIFTLLVAVCKRDRTLNDNTDYPHVDAFCYFLTALEDKHTSHKIDLYRRGLACHPRRIFLKHWPSKHIKEFVGAAHKRGDAVRSGQWQICQKKKYMPFLLCLQDPTNPTNDLGRKAYAIKHILYSLVAARRKLMRELGHGKLPKKSIYWQENSMLVLFVGQVHEVYNDQRVKLEQYGKQILAVERETRLTAE